MKKLLALILALALLAGFAACGVKPTLANAPLSLGEKYLLDLDYDQAIAAFDEAIKIEPKDPRYRVIKVIVYVLKDDPAGAEQAQDDAFEDDVPGFPALPSPRDPVPFFSSVLEWLREHDLLDFARKLLELLRSRWPEVGFEQIEPVVAETTTATTEATTVETTTAATTTENPSTTSTKASTTTKQPASTFDLGKHLETPFADLAKLLGCSDITKEVETRDYGEFGGIRESENITYTNNKNGTVMQVPAWSTLRGIEWTTPEISLFGIKPGDAWDIPALNKILNANGYGNIEPSGYDMISSTLDPFVDNRIYFSDSNGKISGMKIWLWEV